MQKNYWILAIIIVLILGAGMYLINFKNSRQVDQAGVPHSSSFNIVVENRTIVSGPAVLSVKQGDTVSITITANESDELHLHGYDKHIDFSTSTPATLTFVANQSGRFPYEMEGSKTDLGEMDVQP